MSEIWSVVGIYRKEAVADSRRYKGYPPLQEKENLAEYVLRTICKGPPSEVATELNPMVVPLPDAVVENKQRHSKFRTVSWWWKLKVLLQRRLKCEFRDKYSLYSRLFCSAFFGLVLGSIFYQLPLSFAGMMARVSFVFCIGLFSIVQ